MVTRIGIHASVETLFPPTVLVDELADVDPEVTVVTSDDLDDVDALVTFAYDDAFLDADLEWIHSVQSGVDRFPFDDLEAAGIRLTNSTGTHGDSVGETVAGYMLSFARRLHAYRDQQAEKHWEWPAWDEPFTLAGSSLCVVGLGTLGQGIAARADALGMDVVGVKRTPTPVDHVDTVYPSPDLHEAIADAKFVALAVPLTDDTAGMIGEAELDAMRDDAVLVNVARGPVVDQDALVDALEADDLAGAALDVFETEPLPEDSPLWEMDEVVVTPHAAAATRDYPRRMAALVRENVRRIAEGERLANGVV
ncbi:D-2-hydroxyacid dehydrogenase [Halobacterium noricense]|uniref:D-2-hydroxyacid dehydrogenase n=1 Tax=Halobacterium noricense TaxID=223182 RepID=UPI001E518F65|nr:D-2-hydroxyacid dehydrogenase [Halobacterium noricense]UHH26272.1 D-2-hydroxyacid dehydrogenase [Halobacterium noricense]